MCRSASAITRAGCARDRSKECPPLLATRERSDAELVAERLHVETLLGAQAAKYFCYAFGVEPAGNVREDPHGEFPGRNILFQAHTTEETAEHFEKPAEEIAASIAASKAKLLAE